MRMTPPNTFYSSLLLVAGTICLIVGALVIQKRPIVTGTIPLAVLLFALSWWDLTYAAFWGGAPGPTPFFWLDLTYVGVVIAPGAFLIFVLEITSLGYWVKRPLVLSMCVEPLLVLVLLSTDPLHGLFFAGKRVPNAGMILDGGPVFWANIVYSYGLLLIGFILLVRRFIQTTGIYRQQVGVVIAGAGITWLNSFIFVFGLSPISNADNTPVSFTLAALAFAFALTRYHLLDIIPIARDMLIEGMSDGVLVLDSSHRLVDLNPAALKVLGSSPDVKIGQPIEKVFSRWPATAKSLADIHITRVEFPIGDPINTYLDLEISPLFDQKRNFIGRLIIWHDITRLKLIQLELEELATKDTLTSVFNRRHFLHLAEMEFNRSIRFAHPFAIALADIDHFKSVNDAYGHQAGDRVLISFAKVFQENIREVDIFARFGGEEFILLFPETNLEEAFHTAGRILSVIQNAVFDFEGKQIKITASLGVSALTDPKNDTLETVIRKADRALYHAKGMGRNQVVKWDESLKSEIRAN